MGVSCPLFDDYAVKNGEKSVPLPSAQAHLAPWLNFDTFTLTDNRSDGSEKRDCPFLPDET